MSGTIEKIEKYFNSTSQYPLFVVLPTDEYREALVVFSNISKLKVSDYCVGLDKEPDIIKLRDEVKSIIGKYLLIGLGDYLASKSDIAKEALSAYKDLVLQKGTRIAILLPAKLQLVITEMADNDLRVRSRIVLSKNTPMANPEPNNVLVDGIKAYLDACEKGECVGGVKTTLKLQNTYIIAPENAYDELKYRFPNEFNKLPIGSGTLANWVELLENLNKRKENLLQYLSNQKFASLEYIFLQNVKKNDYESWLYYIYLRLNISSSSYLGYAVAKANALEELFESVKTAILEIPINDSRFEEFYTQRKTLLKGCSDADIASFIPKLASYVNDSIAYLTDNTKVEKQTIIVSICDGAKVEFLSKSYPDLYDYTKDFRFEDDRLTRYFSSYKKCKLFNMIDDYFFDVVNEYSLSRPYNSLPSRESTISKLDKDKTYLIFLDALGVEYLGFIREKCAELQLRFSYKISRANLPSITSLNRDFYDDWQGMKETPIKTLDELKHHPEKGYDYNNSPYPIHLAEELDVIKTALERAKTKLSIGECNKVLIASDHGASRLAVISPDVQLANNSCEVKANGRFCQGISLPVGDNLAIENDFAIIADYSRFEGSRIASVETHGGATLEEVIVPIIELTLVDSNIQVILEKSTIEVSFKTIPTLDLIITPDCDSVTASVNGIVYFAEKIRKNTFRFIMPELKKGNYIIDVFENQNKIASKEFIVKSKGFAERDIF